MSSDRRSTPSSASRSASAPEAQPHPRDRKSMYTHFLSIPLHHAPGLQSELTIFAHSSLRPLGVPEKAIRPSACFHLTLGVMTLSDTDVIVASNLLQSLDIRSLLSDPAPLKISLRGMDTMGPPNETTVLYAIPRDPSDRLQPFAERLRDKFADAGLLVKGKDGLRLHATMVNTVYAGRNARSTGRGGKPKWLPDLTELVKNNADYVFARDFEIKAVAICKMGARDLDGVKGAGGYEEVSHKEF